MMSNQEWPKEPVVVDTHRENLLGEALGHQKEEPKIEEPKEVEKQN